MFSEKPIKVKKVKTSNIIINTSIPAPGTKILKNLRKMKLDQCMVSYQ